MTRWDEVSVFAQEGLPVPLPPDVSAGDLADVDPARFSVTIERGQPILTAGWGVGIQRVSVRGAQPRSLLVLVFPKGVRDDDDRWTALARFSQLVALCDGAEQDLSPPAWDPIAVAPPERFLLVLAGPLLAATDEILRRHQRRHYRTEEEELVGRVRGRPLVAAHLRRVVAGAAHRIPCRYEEFDFDNADNRVLKAALRRLATVARALAPTGRLSASLHAQAERFATVSDTAWPLEELRRARFGRVSAAYRQALAWARAALRGVERAKPGRQACELWLDTADLFERFAESIAGRAMGGASVSTQDADAGVFAGRAGSRPDLVLGPRDAPLAIGDAKYKRVCEGLRGVGPPGAISFVQSLDTRISAADSYQLYAYLRLRGCATGFYVVPYWDSKAPAAAIDHAFTFTRSPLDGPHEARAFALGVNLVADPVEALEQAATALRGALGNARTRGHASLVPPLALSFLGKR